MSLNKLTARTPTLLDCQARRIIVKFGGARGLARALARIGRAKDPSAIYRWMYPRTGDGGGTGGLVPTGAWPDVLLAARNEGIFINSDERDPKPDEDCD